MRGLPARRHAGRVGNAERCREGSHRCLPIAGPNRCRQAAARERFYGRAGVRAQPVLEVERGDVLFFSTLLVHQSGTNVSPGIRWSCHFRYNNLREATFIERGYPHPYLYKPQSDLITPDFPSPAEVRAVFPSES